MLNTRTMQEAIDKYVERFGGFPYFLFSGATDEQSIQAIKKALEEGKEINVADKSCDF